MGWGRPGGPPWAERWAPVSAGIVPGVTVRMARSRARWSACRSWLRTPCGGFGTLIYNRGPPVQVTGVTSLRVTRRAVDLLWVAVRVALRRSQVQIPGLAHQVVPEAVMRLFMHQAEAGL